MKQSNLRKMIVGAIFCALVFAATCILIPVPGGIGNLNLGDGMLLLGAWILGGPWAVVAASFGAALADLASGYLIYAPATAIIKALMVVVAIASEKALRRSGRSVTFGRVISAVCAELVMVAGYLTYEAFVIGIGAAALPGAVFNLLQGVLAVAVSVFGCRLLDKAGFKFHKE